MLGDSAVPHACTLESKRTLDSMFGGAQFVPRRSTEAGALIKDRDQEQSEEGRPQDQVPNLQKSVFVPQLVMDNNEQSRPIAQHLYDRRHCVRYTTHKPSRTKRGTFPHPHAPHPYSDQERRPGDVQLMKHSVKSPSYGVDSATYHQVRRSIGKWIAADCLPYRTVQAMAFRLWREPWISSF